MLRVHAWLWLFVLSSQLVDAQTSTSTRPFIFHRDGRWSVGIRGGGTMWFNDFDTRRLAGGTELYVRYGLTRRLSVGVIGSYVALQAQQQELFPGTTLQFDYIETKGFAADLVAWYHFGVERRFFPYVYAGVGGYLYNRKVSDGLPYPDSRSTSAVHIPLGFGTELIFSRNVGFNADFGVRIMDDNTDFWKGTEQGTRSGGAFDFYATGKIGLSFYIGASDSEDEDGDGLTNEEERTLGLDPLRADSDADGLGDGEEVNISRTDPKNRDSDGDGLRDGDEVTIFRTSPLNRDSDGDGVFDGDEVMRYKTDPLKSDTDSDSLSDGEEVLKHRTDPLKRDTEGDGLSDGDEVALHTTDPLNADTDGGTVNDGQEVRNATNPLDRQDDVPKPAAPIQIGETSILEGIVFESGRTTILSHAAQVLQRALQILRDHPDMEVEIRGYTDSIGSAAANRQLSQRRAEAVREWLILRSIAPQRLKARGYGSEFPIADNATPEGRAKNRRIEFFRTK